MNINGQHTRTIWVSHNGWDVKIIDQTKLPHRYEIVRLTTMEEAAHAIKAMLVRGAPLIGATAAYGMALAMRHDSSDASMAVAYQHLYETRPTAVNLRWGLDQMRKVLGPLPPAERIKAAYAEAARIADEDVAICSSIGDHGAALFRALWERRASRRR